MTTSRFQNLRAAFAALVVARLTTDGVTGVNVSAYPPMGNVTREDWCWIGRITTEQDPLTMGGTGRIVDEMIELAVHIRCPVNGSDSQDAAEAESRAELILASVENAVRTSPTISGTVMTSDIDRFESVPDWDELGAVGTIEATVTAQANI